MDQGRSPFVLDHSRIGQGIYVKDIYTKGVKVPTRTRASGHLLRIHQCYLDTLPNSKFCNIEMHPEFQAQTL